MRYTIALLPGCAPAATPPAPTRPISYNADFVVEIPAEVQGLVNLGGIESPGLTAAPAIAAMVVELLRDAGEKLVEKPRLAPDRPPARASAT